jgi:hypothetical protein
LRGGEFDSPSISILIGGEFDSPSISILIEFYPDFDTDDGLLHVFYDSTNSNRYEAAKNASGTMSIFLGSVLISEIAEATYSPHWLVGERNQLVVSGISGNTSAWLNGNEILTNDLSSWTPKRPTNLYIGTYFNADDFFFKGRITQFKVFKSRLTDQEVSDFWTHSTYNYRNKAVLDLPMRAAQHESTQTLDVSRNNNHAVFGAGAAAPTKLAKRGYSTDGGDCMVSPVGEFVSGGDYSSFVVCRLATPASNAAIMSIENTALSEFAGNYIFIKSNSTMRVGGPFAGEYAELSGIAIGQLLIVIGVYSGGTSVRAWLNGVEGTPNTGSFSSTINSDTKMTHFVRGNLVTAPCGSGTEIYQSGIIPFALTPIQVADIHGKMMRSINRI